MLIECKRGMKIPSELNSFVPNIAQRFITMYKPLCILMGLLYSVGIFSQDTVYFKKGLMVQAANRYGREAIYTDLLAYGLYNQTLNKPIDGGALDDSNKNV